MARKLNTPKTWELNSQFLHVCSALNYLAGTNESVSIVPAAAAAAAAAAIWR